MTPHMLRVRPHVSVSDLPVPMPGGKRLTRAQCPPEGFLIADGLFVRRRILFNELELVSEGAAALPKAPVPAPATTKGASA